MPGRASPCDSGQGPSRLTSCVASGSFADPPRFPERSTMATACFEGLTLSALNVALFLSLMGLRDYMIANVDVPNNLMFNGGGGGGGGPADNNGVDAPAGTPTLCAQVSPGGKVFNRSRTRTAKGAFSSGLPRRCGSRGRPRRVGRLGWRP